AADALDLGSGRFLLRTPRERDERDERAAEGDRSGNERGSSHSGHESMLGRVDDMDPADVEGRAERVPRLHRNIRVEVAAVAGREQAPEHRDPERTADLAGRV